MWFCISKKWVALSCLKGKYRNNRNHLDPAVNCNKCLITSQLQSLQLSSAVKTKSWKIKFVLRKKIETAFLKFKTACSHKSNCFLSKIGVLIFTAVSTPRCHSARISFLKTICSVNSLEVIYSFYI